MRELQHDYGDFSVINRGRRRGPASARAVARQVAAGSEAAVPRPAAAARDRAAPAGCRAVTAFRAALPSETPLRLTLQVQRRSGGSVPARVVPLRFPDTIIAILEDQQSTPPTYLLLTDVGAASPRRGEAPARPQQSSSVQSRAHKGEMDLSHQLFC
jgi:hypothetical protein